MTRAVLKCVAVSKAFGGITALEDVTVAFPPSGIVAIIGPNGAGKTTLLDIMSGFRHPDGGKCFVRNGDISKLSAHAVARAGLVRSFQQVRLANSLSVLENMLLACGPNTVESLPRAFDRRGIRKWEAARRVELEAILHDFELHRLTNMPAATLSFGQQKLLSLACCIARQASILLLDEPTAGLDSNATTHVVAAVHDLRSAGRLVVFVEHDLALVRQIAEAVVVLQAGRLVAHGTPDEVLAQPGIVESFIA